MFPDIAIAVLGLTASTLQMVTPNELYQCQPATLSWTPTTPPYILSVILSDLHPTFNTSLGQSDRWIDDGESVMVIPNASTTTWVVDLPEGLNVTMHLKDGKGDVSSGWPRVIGAGSDQCLTI